MANVRVLHLINGEFFAGAERVQDLLALRLPEFGFDCGFLCLKPRDFPRHRKSLQAPLLSLPMRSRMDLWRVAGQVAEALRDGSYQVLHTHTVRAGLIGRFAARRAGVPWVHHIHSPARRETEQGLRNRVNAFIEEQICLPGADRILTVSGSLKTYLTGLGVDADRIDVVPNGVPVWSERCTWTAPEDGAWVVGTVALFRPRKGLDVLLKAFARTKARHPRARLLAVGGFETAEHEAEMRRLADDLGLSGAIEWTGFTEDVRAQFRRMHAFVLPSLYGEGLPMVLIEAMAAGLPVLATEVEGIPEVLGRNEAGMVVAPGSVDALEAGLDAVLGASSEDVSRLAAAGHARQSLVYSDRAMASRMAQIYRGLLGRQALVPAPAA